MQSNLESVSSLILWCPATRNSQPLNDSFCIGGGLPNNLLRVAGDCGALLWVFSFKRFRSIEIEFILPEKRSES